MARSRPAKVAKTTKLLDNKELRKQFPSYINCQVLADDLEERLRLPSRCIDLNYKLGGGLCYGTWTELAGYESTGKSLLAMDFGYVAQQLGGVLIWADAERAFDFKWGQKNGLDLSRIEIYRGEDIEGISDWSKAMMVHWRSKLTNNEPIVLVIDTIAALETKDNLATDEKNTKAEMGNRAKAIYRYYRKRNRFLDDLGVVGIVINQVRKKVGATMFEAAETMPGGDATKFYASVRLMLHRSKQVKGFVNTKGKWTDSIDKGEKVGQSIILEISKNKTAPPAGRFKTEVYFIEGKYDYVGYSKYAGLPDILLKLGTLKKQGSRWYYKDEMICNGEDNLVPLLHEKPKLRGRIIRSSGIATISKFRERLESITKNLYPLKGVKMTDDDEDE